MNIPGERRVAAFFDIDGTLVPPPSLEWRLFRQLQNQGAIPAGNYALWLAEMIRLLPRGPGDVRHANKMYLCGVSVEAVEAAAGKTGWAFFPTSLERACWHAAEGHALVLVSGTLEPLAKNLASLLEAKLRARGCGGRAVDVCATRIEERGGLSTGRILGRPMFGRAKLDAVQKLAHTHGFSLAESYAYGDSASDRWLLAAVGHPVAVHPSARLARMASVCGWSVAR